MKGLKSIRMRLGLTQARIGEMTGIASNTLSRYERGVLTPSADAISTIARALNVTTDELLNGPASRTWELRVIYKKQLKGDVIDLTGNASNAEVLLGDEAMSIKIDGPIELWMDNAKFEDLIADLRRKREAGMRTRKEGW